MANDHNIKKIDGRDWDSIRDRWLEHIPNISSPGDAPPLELKKFFGLQEIYSKAAAAKGVPHLEEVKSLRSSVLWEGIYLIHKSIHVSGAAILHLDNGQPSWSLSNVYQSSLFAVKGILALLGLSIPRLSQPFMIDCFPKRMELTRSQIKKGHVATAELKFWIFNNLNHVEHWEMLRRVLFTSTISCWDQEVIDFLKAVSGEQFVEERNCLHYINNYWTIPKDLYMKVNIGEFANNFEFTTNYTALISNCGKEYSFYINYTLINMALALIKDLGNLSTTVNDEFQLMINTIKSGMHVRFLNSIDSKIL